MKTLNVRFQPTTIRSTVAHPSLKPGDDPRDDGRSVVEITEIPDDVSTTTVLQLWDSTADLTHIGKPDNRGRHSFRYSELSPGRMIFA